VKATATSRGESSGSDFCDLLDRRELEFYSTIQFLLLWDWGMRVNKAGTLVGVKVEISYTSLIRHSKVE